MWARRSGVTLAGDSVTVDASSYFSDPDGEVLTYAAASSDEAVTTVTAHGGTVTVGGVTRGTAIIIVTATDPQGAGENGGVWDSGRGGTVATSDNKEETTILPNVTERGHAHPDVCTLFSPTSKGEPHAASVQSQQSEIPPVVRGAVHHCADGCLRRR